jgi:hypothetical protein
MSLLCWWHRRGLSYFAALESDIENEPALREHLSQCESCRLYWQELRSLTSGLSQLTAPKASAMFVTELHGRLAPAPVRSANWQMALAPALAVSGLLLGWTAWHTLSPAPQTVQIQFPPKPMQQAEVTPPTNDIAQRTPQSLLIMRSNTAYSLRKNYAPRRSYVDARPTGSGRIHFTKTNAQDHAVAAEPILTASEDARRWKECGMLLEAGGESRLAEAAYRAAYIQHPTMQTAYDMGRSAEETGDTDDALDIYADLLASTDARIISEKGNNP